uniref:EGF-like domain-containing protein n=1 Tax=Glossina austeni TaxID=7395 RepID=A0A1A9UI44_GLOAU
MYECDCIEGYELNKNGYSCQVINSTSSNDGHSKSDEDVLYQKGASFSAKLANDNSGSNHLSPSYAASSALTSSSSSDESDEDDSIYISDDMSEQQQQQEQEQEQQQQQVNSNDYYISNENIINNNNYNYNNFNENLNNNNNNNNKNDNQNAYDNDKHYQNARQAYRINLSTEKPLNLIIYRNKENRNNLLSPPTSTTLTAAPRAAAAAAAAAVAGNGIISTVVSVPESMLNINIDDLNDYYTKQDMSVYDDVNNNQLNLRPLNRLTYQQQKQQEQEHPITFNNQEHKQFIATSAVNSGQRANRLATADIISRTSSSSNSIQLPLPDLIISRSNELISTNISLNLSSPLQSINEILCSLDCGLEGLCDNAEGMPRCLCPFGKNGNDCSAVCSTFIMRTVFIKTFKTISSVSLVITQFITFTAGVHANVHS